MNKDGGAAFPNVLVTVDKNGSQNFIVNNGMTMRQWYKGMALMSMMTCRTHDWTYTDCVEYCAKYADAMLAEDAEREGEDDRE